MKNTLMVRVTAGIEIDWDDFRGDTEDELDLPAVAKAAESDLSTLGTIHSLDVDYA